MSAKISPADSSEKMLYNEEDEIAYYDDDINANNFHEHHEDDVEHHKDPVNLNKYLRRLTIMERLEDIYWEITYENAKDGMLWIMDVAACNIRISVSKFTPKCF